LNDRILFIHNPSTRVHNMIKSNLRKAGFVVIPARNAKEIREKCVAGKPFLILLDLAVSPSPWELCQMSRQEPDTCSIPIIVLTEKTSAADMINAGKYSVEGYMARPYDSQLILNFAIKFTRKKHQKNTILVVEDDEAILNIVETNLRNEGYNILSASNPLKALDIAREEEFQLLLTDVMMPELDGISLYMEIKKLPGKEHMPVIILTSKTHFEDMRYAYHQGVEIYMTKPFDPIELIENVRRVMSV
jgi:two-component system, OmpR family, alkaline phosphatase synthesis response regulator PhoP